MLEGHRLLGLTLGAEIAERRNDNDPLQNAVADGKLHQTILHAHREIASILIEHVQKIHRNHRAHYSPEHRFRILRVKQLLGWTQKQTAACFDLDSNTIARWESESKHHPEKEPVGSLLKPQPPVLRFADVVRHLVQTMAASGFGGSERIAQTLAKKPVPPPEASTERKPMVAVKARGPNHVVMADVTDVPSLFRLFTFKLAVVFDVFSRFPLAARVFPQEPSGAQLADLFREGVKKRESPRHFVSDRGPQFTSEDFRDVIHEHSISHRFGAIGKVGSIALIERLW